MTSGPAPSTPTPAGGARRRPAARPRAWGVMAATLGLFLAVFALLVFQLRNGRDPALGRGALVASAPTPVVQPPRRVLLRKVIITRVVVHLPGDDGGTRVVPVRLPANSVVPVAPAPSAPAAPVQAAPVAPAPAPPPVTTRSS